MNVRYSILIPTRNGIKYLPFAIQTVLNQAEQSIELIVSDNYSSDGTWEFLDSLKDERVTVVRPPSPLSMVKHFEFILSLAKGEWISLLGDDDGLQPYFFHEANRLVNDFAEYEVICGRRSYYFWPGCEDLYGNTIVDYSATCSTEVRNSKEQLVKLLLRDGLYFDEPQFYTGTIFRRQLIERIKLKQGGVLLNSILPDANGTALILKYCKTYVYSDIPLCWVGSSPKSTGFDSLTARKPLDDLTISSNKDFVRLNTTDNIAINPKYKNAMQMFDIKVFFLESLAQAQLLNNSSFIQVFELYPLRYLKFIYIYRNYIYKISSKPEIAKLYVELFRDHGLSLIVLKVFYLTNRFLNRTSKRIGQIFFMSHNNRLALFSLSSKNHSEYPTIIKAGEATLEIYFTLIKGNGLRTNCSK